MNSFYILDIYDRQPVVSNTYIFQGKNMKKGTTLAVIIASCLLAGNAFSADWKFYGEFASAPDTGEALFYDAESINNLNNSIKLWTRIVPTNDIEKSLTAKSVIEKARKKIANGYIAPISKIFPKATNAVYFEEAVNESTIKSKTEILYQIECNENKFRRISQITLNKDGSLYQRLGITKWEDIAPDSNADNLARIVCGSK